FPTRKAFLAFPDADDRLSPTPIRHRALSPVEATLNLIRRRLERLQGAFLPRHEIIVPPSPIATPRNKALREPTECLGSQAQCAKPPATLFLLPGSVREWR